jgi:hypothetical protein
VLHAAAIPRGQVPRERQFEPTDDKLETLIYELSGLTEEQIAIVEGRDHSRH